VVYDVFVSYRPQDPAVGYGDRIELRDPRTTGLLQTLRSPGDRTWDLHQQAWRRTLCQLVDRDFTEPERQRFFPGGRPEPACEG
jgi:hypothetical protein